MWGLVGIRTLEDPYYFTLEPIDATAPQLLAMDVALVSESQVPHLSRKYGPRISSQQVPLEVPGA